MSARRPPVFRVAAILTTARVLVAVQWEPPPVAISRQTFEMAYPKTTVSAAVLELERLSAALGSDMSPEDPERPHPDVEAAKAARSSIAPRRPGLATSSRIREAASELRIRPLRSI
jgi:hypothetical protein